MWANSLITFSLDWNVAKVGMIYMIGSCCRIFGGSRRLNYLFVVALLYPCSAWVALQGFEHGAPVWAATGSGWPDWANFRISGDCFGRLFWAIGRLFWAIGRIFAFRAIVYFWADFENYKRSPSFGGTFFHENVVFILIMKKMVWSYIFGRFFSQTHPVTGSALWKLL
jgi:hypothetical protein